MASGAGNAMTAALMFALGGVVFAVQWLRLKDNRKAAATIDITLFIGAGVAWLVGALSS